jgi:hypothetical protein
MMSLIRDANTDITRSLPCEVSEYYGTPFISSNGKILAAFKTGLPALTSFEYGKGKIYIYNYSMRSKGVGSALMLSNLLNKIAKNADCIYGSDKLKDIIKKWDQFRCDQVTKMVKAVKEAIENRKPDIELSASVVEVPNPERVVFQDWKHWLNSGYIDAAYPMDYFQNNSQLQEALKYQLVGVNDKSKIRPLISVYTRETGKIKPVSVSKLHDQLDIVRNLGFSSVGIFSTRHFTFEHADMLKNYLQNQISN